MSNQNITINSRKYDGNINRTWKADLIEQDKTLLVFRGEFDREIKHRELGVIRRGTISYEYYWLDRWFSVFRFHEPEGEFRNFYCNINMPPTFENGVLDYIDLEIDILIWKDFSFQILDAEEFEENAEKFNFNLELRTKVEQNVNVILSLIRKREFPLDYAD